MKVKNKIWFITKILFLSISFLIYAFFIFRLCSTGSPDSMKHVVWDDTAAAAYRADPEAFEIWKQEPVSYITDDGRFWISDILYLPEAKQLQITVIFVTHDLAEAFSLADRLLVLEDGRISDLDTPQGLLKEHHSDLLKEFLK